MMRAIAVLLLCLFSTSSWAQPNAGPTHTYHRLICILPYTGKGTWEDPKRPLFAPLASELGRGKSGILAYYHEPTDDGKAAIVIFIAADRASLAPILAAQNAPGVAVFEAGKQNDQQILAAIKAVKKDFDLKRFALRVQ